MRKTVACLLTAGVLLGSAACSAPEPVKGTVVEADYDPTTYKTSKKCTTTNGKQTCKSVSSVKERENWDITVRPEGGGDDQEIDVSKAVYDACKIGAWYNGTTCS